MGSLVHLLACERKIDILLKPHQRHAYALLRPDTSLPRSSFFFVVIPKCFCTRSQRHITPTSTTASVRGLNPAVAVAAEARTAFCDSSWSNDTSTRIDSSISTIQCCNSRSNSSATIYRGDKSRTGSCRTMITSINNFSIHCFLYIGSNKNSSCAHHSRSFVSPGKRFLRYAPEKQAFAYFSFFSHFFAASSLFIISPDLKSTYVHFQSPAPSLFYQPFFRFSAHSSFRTKISFCSFLLVQSCKLFPSDGWMRCSQSTTPFSCSAPTYSPSFWFSSFPRSSRALPSFSSFVSSRQPPSLHISFIAFHCPPGASTASAAAGVVDAQKSSNAASTPATAAALPKATTAQNSTAAEFPPAAVFQEGENDEEEFPGEFMEALLLSDVCTPERARLWLKPSVLSYTPAGAPVRAAAPPADFGTSCLNNVAATASVGSSSGGLAQSVAVAPAEISANITCAAGIAAGAALISASLYDAEAAPRKRTVDVDEKLNETVIPWEGVQAEEADAAPTKREEAAWTAAEAAAREDGARLRAGARSTTAEEAESTTASDLSALDENEEYEETLASEGHYEQPLLLRRQIKAAAAATPGATLLSRLAVAEREALLSTPKRKKNYVGIGGEVYVPPKKKLQILKRERRAAENDGDMRNLAFDRRLMEPSSLRDTSARPNANLFLPTAHCCASEAHPGFVSSNVISSSPVTPKEQAKVLTSSAAETDASVGASSSSSSLESMSFSRFPGRAVNTPSPTASLSHRSRSLPIAPSASISSPTLSPSLATPSTSSSRLRHATPPSSFTSYSSSASPSLRGEALNRRLRVLDLDAVPAASLHHTFMYLLVKHFPAEVCVKVTSRIALFRDSHSQTAYENLLRDLGYLFTPSAGRIRTPGSSSSSRRHTTAATGHMSSSLSPELGAAMLAYLSRIIQTISIAWMLDYIRRFACFSKRFIVRLIERSAHPRLFDCVRYQQYGGIKPLPPIITHPHRLSSYVRLLSECSAKFYLFVNLKRHGQIPLHHSSSFTHLTAGGDRQERDTAINASHSNQLISPFADIEAPLATTANAADIAAARTTSSSRFRPKTAAETEEKLPFSSVLSESFSSKKTPSAEAFFVNKGKGLQLPRAFEAAEKMLLPSPKQKQPQQQKRQQPLFAAAPNQLGQSCSKSSSSEASSSSFFIPIAVTPAAGRKERKAAAVVRAAVEVDVPDEAASVEETASVMTKKERKSELLQPRPPIYDLILAAEHLGVDYRALLNARSSHTSSPTAFELLTEKSSLLQGERNSRSFIADNSQSTRVSNNSLLASDSLFENQDENWSADEEEQEERELREFLQDDEEVYNHIRQRYLPARNNSVDFSGCRGGNNEINRRRNSNPFELLHSSISYNSSSRKSTAFIGNNGSDWEAAGASSAVNKGNTRSGFKEEEEEEKGFSAEQKGNENQKDVGEHETKSTNAFGDDSGDERVQERQGECLLGGRTDFVYAARSSAGSAYNAKNSQCERSSAVYEHHHGYVEEVESGKKSAEEEDLDGYEQLRVPLYDALHATGTDNAAHISHQCHTQVTSNCHSPDLGYTENKALDKSIRYTQLASNSKNSRSTNSSADSNDTGRKDRLGTKNIYSSYSANKSTSSKDYDSNTDKLSLTSNSNVCTNSSEGDEAAISDLTYTSKRSLNTVKDVFFDSSNDSSHSNRSSKDRSSKEHSSSSWSSSTGRGDTVRSSTEFSSEDTTEVGSKTDRNQSSSSVSRSDCSGRLTTVEGKESVLYDMVAESCVNAESFHESMRKSHKAENSHAPKSAAYRLQCTPVAPLPCSLHRGSSTIDETDGYFSTSRTECIGMRKRSNKGHAAKTEALVPLGEPQQEEQTWGWQWEFNNSRSYRNIKTAAENDCAFEEVASATRDEPWWGTPWGRRRRSRFNYKGKTYAIVLGEGWKQIEGKTEPLLKPKRRKGRHEPKRERRMERKVRLRRVQQELNQQE